MSEGASEGGREGARGGVGDERPSATVLLVDDTPENIGLLLDELERVGYRVLVALDGVEALEVAARAEPELILLDVMMPGIDGYETCLRLKAAEATRDIPVIFMTALADPDARLRGFAVGGVDYITKPFNRQEVRLRVRTHIALRHAQRAVAHRGRELEQRARDVETLARMVSHELRNPLSTLTGGLETIEEQLSCEELDEIREMLPWLREVAGQMTDAIGVALLLLEVSRGSPETVTVDTGYILQHALEELEREVSRRGATIELPGGLPRVRGRGTWLIEVWTRVLDNAIRYGGDPPQVRVEIERDGGLLRFVVLDNGPGLDDDQRARAFDEFTRFHPDRARGNGLGLALVRRIIRCLGGEVGAAPRPGGGLAVWFTLPPA